MSKQCKFTKYMVCVSHTENHPVPFTHISLQHTKKELAFAEGAAKAMKEDNVSEWFFLKRIGTNEGVHTGYDYLLLAYQDYFEVYDNTGKEPYLPKKWYVPRVDK